MFEKLIARLLKSGWTKFSPFVYYKSGTHSICFCRLSYAMGTARFIKEGKPC